MYLIRGCAIKPKDIPKLHRLRQYIEAHPEGELDDSYYEPYKNFARRVQEKYPWHIRIYQGYWQLDHLLGDKISGSKGRVYDLIDLFTPHQ